MAIAVTCACGANFNLKDEHAGRRLKCPKCAGVIQVPAVAVAPSILEPVGAVAHRSPPPMPSMESTYVGEHAAAAVPLTYEGTPAVAAAAPHETEPLFQRDRFLLRQKHLSINQKYYVWDEAGQTIGFVMRPAHVMQNLGALLAAIVVFLIVGGSSAAVGFSMGPRNQELTAILTIVGVVLGFVAAVAVVVALQAKRHVGVYADEAMTRRLLQITQENKFQIINAFYTVRTHEGEVLARLRKNHLYNFFRKRWYVSAPEGGMITVVKEDSIILSLLRRAIGGIIGSLIRTNFIFLQGESERVIGVFNRKFTILDRYVLDMSADPGHTIDRRVALAVGVMLDSGERR